MANRAALGLVSPSGRRRWQWVALAILLSSSLLALQPGARGWRPDHAHISLGAVAPHTHPWEHVERDPHDTAEDAQADQPSLVAFADSDIAGATAAIPLPGVPDLWAVAAGVTDYIAVAVPLPASYAPAVPAPPPRP